MYGVSGGAYGYTFCVEISETSFKYEVYPESIHPCTMKNRDTY